ncbi:MAG: molybdopterin-dependent oxidoreductase [Chloroflexi bacterium]|nr:molybdopterin-dependent oxidoreductase [Chloroflexota bacterium]
MTTPIMTRRDFLKLSAATAGVLAASDLLIPFSQVEPALASAPIGSETWIPTACNMCGGQTGVYAKVVDGRVAKIEPNPDNPIGVSNISTDYWAHKREGAAMCPKGNAAVMQIYDPDRVKKPLKRTNPEKGKDVDPRFVEISWDEAYNTIAAKLKALRDAGEAHKLIYFSEDHSFVNIQADFCDLYGTPNYHNHSNLCDVARKASFKLVMGDERPLADFVQSRYIVLFGWNPTSATKWSHLPRVISRAMENGARMVVVDPNLSQTAARAQWWIPLRPGTDGALALGVAHEIIKRGYHDQAFIDEWTVGFDQYKDYLFGKVDGVEKSPEWAEQITTVPAANIRKLAFELGTTKPALVDVWSGPGQHSNAVQGGRAIALLNVLLGNVDKPGTMMNPERRGNARQAPKKPALDSLKQPRLDGHLTKYPFSHGSGIYTETLDNLRLGKGAYIPKIGMVVFQNLVLSVPGTQNVIDALKKLEFLTVVDTHLSETALLADIVIPGTTYLERYDFTTNWVTWTNVSLRQPVVKPIFGQPAEYEFVTELGRRLGLTDGDGKDYFRLGKKSQAPVDDLTKWYEEYLSLELEKGGPAITLDQLKALPGATWIDPKGTTYEKFKSEVKPPDGSATKDKAQLVKSADGTRLLGYVDSSKAAFDLDGKTFIAPSDAKFEDVIVIVDKDNKLWGFVVSAQPNGYADAKGVLRDKAMAVVAVQMKSGKFSKGFNTLSRKLEFFSAQAAAKKDANGNQLDGLPAYAPRDWQPNKDFPMYLVNWKEASHTHSRTFNNPWLMGIQPSNPIALNAKTAAKLGIKDGDAVWIESPYGKAKASVHLTEGIHPEVVGWQHGFGHWGFGKVARGKGTGDGQFNVTKSDAISGMALHKEVCVKIYRA